MVSFTVNAERNPIRKTKAISSDLGFLKGERARYIM
jgi:hypothetical protein